VVSNISRVGLSPRLIKLRDISIGHRLAAIYKILYSLFFIENNS
jgi:hypothetical protein